MEGAVGELLRREGLYSSHLTDWHRQRETGELVALSPKKRGRKAHRNELADENAKLKRELARTRQELSKANTVIDVQRKVAAPPPMARAGQSDQIDRIADRSR